MNVKPDTILWSTICEIFNMKYFSNINILVILQFDVIIVTLKVNY